MMNLPFWGGKAALRIVGSYSYDAGWIDRVVIAPGHVSAPDQRRTPRYTAATCSPLRSRRSITT